MKAFKIVPSIAEYVDFRTLAKELKLGARDLILTNEYIYNPTIAALELGCHTCFQEKFGGGEPTDVMVDAILDDLRGKEFDRIIAVGGGTVIDIAKVLTVAKSTDRVDDLYDRMANLEKEHELIIVPTTCGTGSEVPTFPSSTVQLRASRLVWYLRRCLRTKRRSCPACCSVCRIRCSRPLPSMRWSTRWRAISLRMRVH